MADYRAQASQQLDPQYNAKVTALKNSLANQLQTLDQSKTGVNTNYDTQVGLQNIANTRNKNNLSNTALGRGLGRSSIITSNLGEADQINTRQVGQINTARTGALNNIEQQKALANNNTTNTLTTMAGDRESQIASLAKQLESADWQRQFQERQFQAEQAYKQQQLAIQREQMAMQRANAQSKSFSNVKANINELLNQPLQGGGGMIGDRINTLNSYAQDLASQGDKQGAQYAYDQANNLRAQLDGNHYAGIENSDYANGRSSSSSSSSSSGSLLSRLGSILSSKYNILDTMSRH